MKWYQQDVKSHTDEKCREIILEHGLEGYGLFILCLELIAEKIDSKMVPEIDITFRVLREKSRLSHQKLTKILSFFDQISVIYSNFSEKTIHMSCPNLLKRLDNWTKRSVAPTEKVSTNKNKKENKKEKTNSASVHFWFEEIWSKYPNRVGKKQAQRHYEATVKSEEDRLDCQDALVKYQKHLEENTWKKPQNGSTWFNNWRDWFDWVEPVNVESKADKLERSLKT